MSRVIGAEIEQERQRDGRHVETLTLFLAGAECLFTCTFCDLWRYTIDGPTPPSAIPNQIRQALQNYDTSPPTAIVKLYNASNFFDSRAVPPADDDAIAELVRPFTKIVVEAHPKLIGERCLEFARRCNRRLEVALGFETFHPLAMLRLNKQASRRDYLRASERLSAAGIGLRAFVLVGAPYIPREEALEWIISTARSAVELGAEHISLIPVRGGNGEIERLAELGFFTAPRLVDFENALDHCLELDAVVTADLWNLELLETCSCCFDARKQRLAAINSNGLAQPRVSCDQCGDSP